VFIIGLCSDPNANSIQEASFCLFLYVRWDVRYFQTMNESYQGLNLTYVWSHHRLMRGSVMAF